MDNRELASNIIQNLGGEENISNYLHCVTRLRFNLIDENKADMDKISNFSGVLGTQIKNGQYQVIIGPNVKKVYEKVEEIMKQNGVNIIAGEQHSKKISTCAVEQGLS